VVRIFYRARQLWSALAAALSAEDIERISEALTPDQMMLFLRLQPGEQAHSFRIYRQLCEQSETNRDLLVAALLHDVGKSCHPLHLWERVEIVFVKHFAPEKMKEWGRGEPRGWKRPFVVAEQHAAWGAQMAAQAGASPLAVALIQRHQESYRSMARFQSRAASPEDLLLHRLQVLDNQS
jgi:putative nucleotidyltransferase with HDIG domain